MLLVAVFIATALPISPESPTKLQRVEAIVGGPGIPVPLPVLEEGLNLRTNIKTTVESTISAAENIAQTVFATKIDMKEFVLDPLMWALAEAMIANMLTSLTTWVNSGFSGSPAFVTNLDSFLAGVVDRAVGDFLVEKGLGFFCSPFTIDIRLALDLEFFGGGGGARGEQCTLSDITGNIESFVAGNFTEGGWAGWFELTQGPTNDPNKAFLGLRTEAYAVARNARGEEFEILSANKFFKNIQICEEGVSLNGSISTCTVTTPGNILNEQFNNALDIPNKKVAFADEFDELVGAVLNQFASQVFMGVNGLLGMGGNSAFAFRDSENGNRTYLDQTLTTSLGGNGGFRSNVNAAIRRQRQYQNSLQRVIDRYTEQLAIKEAEVTDIVRNSDRCRMRDLPQADDDSGPVIDKRFAEYERKADSARNKLITVLGTRAQLPDTATDEERAADIAGIGCALDRSPGDITNSDTRAEFGTIRIFEAYKKCYREARPNNAEGLELDERIDGARETTAERVDITESFANYQTRVVSNTVENQSQAEVDVSVRLPDLNRRTDDRIEDIEDICNATSNNEENSGGDNVGNDGG